MDFEKEPIDVDETVTEELDETIAEEDFEEEAEAEVDPALRYEGLLNIVDTLNLIFAFLFTLLGVISFILVSRENFDLIGKSVSGSFYTDMRFDLGYFIPFAISAVALVPSAVLAAIGLNKKRNAIVNTITLFLVAALFLFAAIFFLIHVATRL